MDTLWTEFFQRNIENTTHEHLAHILLVDKRNNGQVTMNR